MARNDDTVRREAPSSHDVLTLVNGELTADADHALRKSVVLVAGCGGIGGAAVEALVRAGAENLVLADFGAYEYRDANHESARIQDIGDNKARAISRRMLEINPRARISSHPEGVTEHNASSFAEAADVIVDGIGVLAPHGLLPKLFLHREARRAGKPVIVGHALSGTQWTLVCDYRNPGTKLFNGAVAESEIPKIEPVEYFMQLVTSARIPSDMVPWFERLVVGQSTELPAFGCTPNLFGALAVQVIFDLLAGQPLRSNIQIDISSVSRPRREWVVAAGKRLGALYRLNTRIRGLRRSGMLGIYSPLEDEAFAYMREYMEEREWDEGSVIVRQGEAGAEFFVLIDGFVNVERDDIEGSIEPQVIATLGPGEYFGELALMTDEPRNASVVAATRCRVLVISRGAFDTYVVESEIGRQRLGETAQQRIRERDGVLDR
jgi:hypothetical protein